MGVWRREGRGRGDIPLLSLPHYSTTAGVDLGGEPPGSAPPPIPNFVAKIFLVDTTPLRDVGKIGLTPSPYKNPGSAPATESFTSVRFKQLKVG